ncbi:MAG: glycosyltransferase family 39 protein [Acidobacteria bacterium]|nr:glycosyltransferase family 39 protein [Acidobacteriota bacterium]
MVWGGGIPRLPSGRFYAIFGSVTVNWQGRGEAVEPGETKSWTNNHRHAAEAEDMVAAKIDLGLQTPDRGKSPIRKERGRPHEQLISTLHRVVPGPELRAIILIVTLLIAVLVSMAATTGVTVDEPAHLLSGYLYWHGQDRLQPGDMPPLIKIVSGWVPYLTALPLPPSDHPDWKSGHEWNISLAMMFRLPEQQIRKYFFLSRLPMILFPVGCCLLIWRWGRQLFNPTTGVLTALAFALSPMVLGHGALVKNDLAASFGFLLFWFCAWRYWREPSLWRAASLGGALLVAILSKFSLLILTPFAPALIIAASVARRPLTLLKCAGSLCIVAVVVYCGMLVAWRLEVGRPEEKDLSRWNANPNIPKPLVAFVEIASQVPTPARFWTGAMSLVESNSGHGGTYLRGKVVEGGDPTYFVTGLGVKVPVPQQILIVAGIILCLFHFVTRRLHFSDLLWFGPPFLYLGLASISTLQHGVRLVLPALTLFILIGGKAIQHLLAGPRVRLLLVVLMGWAGVNAAYAYPHYISYFNHWVGGSDNGIQVLSDSNLDWGQDVPRLAEFIRRNKISKIHLAYFGSDPPHQHIDGKLIEWLAPPWSPSLVSGTRLEPEPGYYAISATLLTGQLFAPEYRDYFAAFRNRKPVAKAGYSIFIYEIPPAAH